MGSWLEWIKDEVREIPGELADKVKTTVTGAVQDAWRNIRTDAGNAVNQIGAALTSSAAGQVAPSGARPITIPLSSGQLLLVVAALAALIGFAVYKAFK